MDITSIGLLSMFGSALAGGLVGFAIGKVTRFEIGLSVGLLIFGAVTLGFAWKCFEEYRAFTTAGSDGLWGEVVEIVDKPSNASGSITSPAPIVKIEGPDGQVHFVEGPTASGAQVGEHVNVIFDRAHPERSRVGKSSDLRGGAIAFMLFGIFPTSFALILTVAMMDEARPARSAAAALPRRRGERASPATKAQAFAPPPGLRGRFGDTPFKLLFAAMFCSILWIGMDGAPLLERFAQGFAGVAAALAGYALWGGFAARLGLTWTFGLLMLALNFGVWAFALHLLR